MSRRSAVQLLVGVLIVGAIPIISTVRILQANAVRSAQANADATLRVEVQSGLRELDRLGDSAAARADGVARLPTVQRAVVAHGASTLRRFAAAHPGVAFYLGTRLVAGPILRVLGDFRRVASQAAVDSLTGLANRRTLDEELALEWRRADRVGDSLAFVLLDLDDFKAVNDRHDHPAGDAVLRAVGEILGAGVRHVDLAGRYGGEEFALILPETDLPGALKLAERIRARLETTAVDLPNGRSLHATASFGVAVNDGLTAAEQLVAAADDALYAAKAAGTNRVHPRTAEAGGGPERKPERRRLGKPKPAQGEI